MGGPESGDVAGRGGSESGDVAGRGVTASAARGKVLTIPNLVTFARLLGVPVFLYLLFGAHQDVAAAIVLGVGGTSDWVDGFLARRLRQVSRLGELLDPLADRLYILATLIALSIKGVLPWWFTVALFGREALLGILLLVLRRHGFGPPPVHYLGKAATFLILIALPVLLLGSGAPATHVWAYPLGWAMAWWGLVLYWIAGAFYVVQGAGALRDREAREAAA
jgi:cardiolipin synthase